MKTVLLKRGRAKPLWAGHPWVLSGAVAGVEGEPTGGDVVRVVDDRGKSPGLGFYAPGSRIRVRMLTPDPAATIDEAFFRGRLRRASELRSSVGLPRADTDAFRLVHSEGDGLPGVIADRYGDHVVLNLTIRGMEERADLLARGFAAETGARGVLLRRVEAFESEEGLAGREGDLLGEPVPEEIEVRERGVRFLVRPREGQKTGHYTDHRENRVLVRGAVRGLRVLDAFTGTGAFAISAALGGAAEVVAVDSSPRALADAERNAAANRVDRVRFRKDDVFRALRRFEREGERFGAVILDPPRMASRRREVKGALRGYKELNLRAMRLLEAGGVLATASCTGLVSEPEFERALRDAALDARRTCTVLGRGGQGPDHPWSIAAPEGRYLKFLIGRVE